MVKHFQQNLGSWLLALASCLLILGSDISYCQPPPGYYDDAQGKVGEELRFALQDIIKDHEIQSNSSLWLHFYTTDDKEDGTVWDMYSDVPGGTPAYVFTFGDDQCGNYSGEGDCYNREHSFPKSWYNDQLPMNTDLFHVYPTDGWVNQKRSNYPYGETNTPTWTSTNGSKIGNCSFTGYSGIIFEPLDEHKGDFARTYFYMMTRYMDIVANWSSDMLEGDNLSQWAEDLLISWHGSDPVSDKEIERNNTVYGIQQNRNPYIDYPEWVYSIWGPSADIEDWQLSVPEMWTDNHNVYVKRNFSSSAMLKIYNTFGQEIMLIPVNTQMVSIPLSLKNGFYLAVLQSDREHYILKFIR